MTRIGIVVVAYNAASTLASVLDRIPDDFVDRISGILVCDNHSEDPTYLVGVGYQRTSPRGLPISVIRQESNLGYGGNQKTGYRWCIEQGYDIAVLLHADGQYAPELLPEMVAPLERGDVDAVFGSRMMVPRQALKGGMPLYKYAGNKVLSTLENRIVGTDLTEWHSGYRAYRVDALEAVPFEQCSDDYDFDTGIILQLHDAGRRILEIPIPTFYGDEISYVNGMRYAREILADVVRYRAHKLGLGSDSATDHWAEADPRVASAPSARLATWLEARPPGRVLVLAEPGAAAVLGGGPAGGAHDATVVVLEPDADVDAVSESALAVEPGSLDAIVGVGLLERSVRPGPLLTACRRALSPGGTAMFAVPNIGHWYPRARIAAGRFRYERSGALARQNLRFFTRTSLGDLLDDAGLPARRWEAYGATGAVDGDAPGRWTRSIDALGTGLVPSLFSATWLVEAGADDVAQRSDDPSSA